MDREWDRERDRTKERDIMITVNKEYRNKEIDNGKLEVSKER